MLSHRGSSLIEAGSLFSCPRRGSHRLCWERRPRLAARDGSHVGSCLMIRAHVSKGTDSRIISHEPPTMAPTPRRSHLHRPLTPSPSTADAVSSPLIAAPDAIYHNRGSPNNPCMLLRESENRRNFASTISINVLPRSVCPLI